MKEERIILKIDEIEFDDGNPRIKGALENMVITSLQSASILPFKIAVMMAPEMLPAFNRLKTSIRQTKVLPNRLRSLEKMGEPSVLMAIHGWRSITIL